MAATLDADQEELLHFSFPIEKQEDTDSINPVDGTPDIWITGKATDGTVDADRQIVDPEWSAVALKEWAATGGNIRMAHDPRRPVGKGHDVQVTMDGHFVRSMISDPLAKHFIRTGVLNDYSVGISMPHIKFGPHKSLDPRGEATGGIITGRPDGLSKIAELSVVDRGSNFHSKFQITRKSAGGGDDFGFIGKMVGDADEITKAAPPALLTKAIAPAPAGFPVAGLTAEDLSITFTPNDMARLLQNKFVEKHYQGLAAQAADTEKRDIGAAERRSIASEGNAIVGSDGHISYPVENAGDLQNAATLARSGHGDVAAARRLIARRAKELGVANPLDDDDKVKKSGDGEVPAAAGPVTEKADGALDDKARAALKALQDVMLAFPVPTGTDAEAAKEADPDLTKSCSKCSGGDCDGSSCPCGNCGDGKCCAPAQKNAGPPKPVKKAKKPKKLPPWLNKPSGDSDGGSGDEKESSGGSGSCKSAHAWEITDPEAGTVECSKCHTSPAEAAGVTASPMDPAPVGELMESQAPASAKGATPQSAGGVKDAPAMSPVPAHREPDGAQTEAFEKDSGMSDGDDEAPTRLEAPTLKASPEVLALLRFKSAGIDPELGRLHDMTCPAYHPDEVAKYHPFAELPSLIDEAHWQRKALDAACGPLEHAIAMQELTGAAFALKAASDADVNDWRLEAHKAFRDANPGPGTYPSPGAVSPRKYNRPLITDGRSATSAGHSGPNTSPVVATTAPNAASFDRPPLSSGQESPSPSFMKWDSGQYPSQQGVPTQLSYAHLEKDKQRMALVQMHDHLSRQFPEVCPLDNVDLSGRASRPLRGIQPENHPVPATAGIGKADDVPAVTKSAPSPAPVAAFKAEPEQGDGLFADADVYKGFKKMRKKLGKKVLAGEMTVDEARTKMGRQFAQKGSSDEDGTAQKSAALKPYDIPGFVPPPPMPLSTVLPSAVQKTATPAVLPAPVAASFGPADIEAAVTKAVGPLLEKIQQQDETYTSKLAETQRVIDAIADQPDPSTAAFSGVAFHPVRKAARPAGVTDIAEAAARARRATERELENLYESASDPFAREGFYAALNKVRGGGSTP